MNVLIIYAHPNPASFCHAILREVETALQEAGHTTRVKDLYAEGFSPVLRASELGALNDGRIPEVIEHEQASLRWAEGLVLIYPLWWFGCPAILKGWLDKVLTNGFAFEYAADGARGLLPINKALLIVTAGGAEDDFEQMQAKDLIVRPVADGALAFCGVSEVQSKVFFSVPTVGDAERRAMLDEVAVLAKGF